MWWEVLLDALKDTLILFPFLLLVYILIELMEHNTRMGKPFRALSGKAAPLVGTAAGVVPMCGFSVMAAKLWQHRHITLGALIAVFIATSDEGLLVLLFSSEAGFSVTERLFSVLGLLGAKLALGVGIGYLVDAFYRRTHTPAPLPVHDRHEEHGHHEEHEGHKEGDEAAHEHGECDCDGLSVCEHKKTGAVRLYFLSPLLHALEVSAFVLLVNLVFGYLIFGVGEEKFIAFLQADGFYWAQPAVCALVGLVPNCASSVLLAETYALGGIGFGGLLGGLVANAGLGYLALFRKKSDIKFAIPIVVCMYALGVAVGYAANAVALAVPI